FYGEALHSGEDIKAELKQMTGSAMVLGSILFFLMVGLVSSSGQTTDSAPAPVSAPSSTPSVPPSELDQKIRQVLKENKYTWRFPRDTVKQPEAEKGPIGRFFES